jgi:hypothetical protein
MLFVTTFAGKATEGLLPTVTSKRFAQACAAVRFWTRYDCSAKRPTIRRDLGR